VRARVPPPAPIIGAYLSDIDVIIDKPAALNALEIPAPKEPAATAAKVVYGRLVPPQQQVLLYSADEWEAFIEEWAHAKRQEYLKVVRLSGANDMGIDVAGITTDEGFFGDWDNYQCKHYDDALTPSVAAPEMLWHSFRKEFVPPRAYYFMAPKGCGMSLSKLLLEPSALKEKVREKWADWCANRVTSKQTITLDGDFLAYFEAFDFSVFSERTALEIIDEHRKTPYFATRFGGGLPARPAPGGPPADPMPEESRYLQQLFEAYGDHEGAELTTLAALGPFPELVGHYNRQREHFYHAEALRNFARDSVPPGTFDSLQDEVHAGVIDLAEANHDDGLARLNAVTQAATLLPLTENGLISVVKVQDRRGICHQLANVDRLKWRP